MSSMNVQQLLAQMRVMEAQASMKPAAMTGLESGVSETGFSDALKNSIESVNEASKVSSRLAEAFEKGNPDISVAELMINMEKASVSFQAMTQVRNRLLSAYQDIMNMPV
ncbi:MAG: flagellar hook-basal body complex protein FliE [Gammaproteobacteria bacterium]|nr:flagellar hook-basal body complex protein FliE [Gammaproteobacteria bacterium]